MKTINFNNLPTPASAGEVLQLVRACYGPTSSLVRSGAGPYFYGFHAVYQVPADVDGWPSLVDLLCRTGRAGWLY